jgi:hypothetical protein
VPAPRAEEKSSKTGLILGIFGVLAALIGIGLFLMMNNKSGDGEKPDDKPQVAKQPDPAPTTAGPTSTGAEVVPEPADSGVVEPADTGADAGAAADAGTDAGELVAETGVEEPEPEPDPDPKPKPKPVAKPKLPPDQALAEARKASLQGDNTKAYSLAKDAYDQNQNGDALNLMGVAACKMGSASKAKAAHRKMTAADKDKLAKLCASVGVEL